MEQDFRARFLRVRQVTDLGRVERTQLLQDLQRYCLLALELGASEARVVGREMFEIDPRVRLKCRIPRCEHYGTNANCPPYTMEVHEFAALVSLYSSAVLLRWDFTRDQILSGEPRYLRTIHEVLASVEAAAFYDGYYFAMGLASGPCRRAFCAGSPCQALTEPAKGCRYPLLARPSMEAMGFNVYRMAHRTGWEIYPVGGQVPEEVPKVIRLGIVLVY